jgi:SAM-dependent methyltransferase
MATADWTNDAGWELPTKATEGRHRARYPADWARYEFAARYAMGKRVLDCACGAGYGSALLVRMGATHAVGVDTSKDAIAWATEHYGSSNIEFRLGNGVALPLEAESIDLVVSFETIEHVPRARSRDFVESFAHVLAPHGHILISTPLNESPSRVKPSNPFHLREYNSTELAEMLAPWFEVESRFGQHSATSRRYADLQRLPGLGQLLRAGAHRILPERLRTMLRERLGRSKTSETQSWISSERWIEAPVQILLGRKK